MYSAALLANNAGVTVRSAFANEFGPSAVAMDQ